MSALIPYHEVGRHAVMPEAGHDETVRFDLIAHLNQFIAQRFAAQVGRAYESQALPAWRMRHGRAPQDRHEVRDAMVREPAYRAYSLLRRNTMEMRQHAGRQLVGRQSEALRVRAQALNTDPQGRPWPTLRLDPNFQPPRYVAAVDQHLMQGGYVAESVEGDVSNPANYDAGIFATVGGSAGRWSDAAGRALVAWLRREHPHFRPTRIVDLGCGLGHNTLPLREAFPQAEIIAIDVAGPMLRYGHARARALGITDVHFWQEDATRTSIETGSCDLVFTTMVLHETSREALPRVFIEAHRLLRAGGLTVHLEQPSYRGLAPFEQFMRDWDGRYNNEPFWSALHETDLPALLVRAGFGAGNVFESRCVAPSWRPGASVTEDFGRAPAWYAVGAWLTVKAHG